MDLKEYLDRAKVTAIFQKGLPLGSHPNYVPISYCALKLNGEAGEVAEQVGKAFRDDEGRFTPIRMLNIKKELGDVLWYLMMICDQLGIDPNEVAEINLDKLAGRAARGMIGGSGDNR